MRLFSIRVLLRSPSTAAEYQRLHATMETAGAQRQIVADDGTIYDLPPAEYYLASDLAPEEVRDRVVGYAKQVDSDPEVLVTEAVSFAWRLPLAA